MVVHCGHRTEGHGPLRRRLSQATGLALGVAMLGTIGLSGTLAQDDGAAVTPDAEAIASSIIEQVFTEVFGGVVVEDTADSGAGDINVGGSTGSTVTMGGGSGGSVNMGGGVTVDDSYGG
jgi:hypothetical protein